MDAGRRPGDDTPNSSQPTGLAQAGRPHGASGGAREALAWRAASPRPAAAKLAGVVLLSFQAHVCDQLGLGGCEAGDAPALVWALAAVAVVAAAKLYRVHLFAAVLPSAMARHVCIVCAPRHLGSPAAVGCRTLRRQGGCGLSMPGSLWRLLLHLTPCTIRPCCCQTRANTGLCDRHLEA